MDEKPFAPTQRKLKKVRQQGEVPRSSLLVSSLTTATILIVIAIAAPAFRIRLLQIMSLAFTGQWPPLKGIFASLVLIMCIAFLVPVIVGLWQSGGLFSIVHLKPKFRFQTPKLSLSGLIFGMSKIAILVIALLFFLSTTRSFSFYRLALLAILTSLAFVLLGLIDWRYRIWKFQKNQRMSAQEKREDEKESTTKKKR